MRIVINYGHGSLNNGSFDPGAIGATGYKESTETAEVGTKIVAKLKANGWDVLAIQDGDLADVTNQSNAFNADYFISVHANAFSDPTAHGVETFALQVGGTGQTIALAIQNDLVAATGLTSRGVKFSNLYVLNYTKCPAVLVEIGFLSNPVEESLMRQDAWDDRVANAICKGFSRAVGVAYTNGVIVPPVTPPVTPTVMYRIILDGVQTMAVASQAKAIALVHAAVDTGAASIGIVQRNDGVEIISYIKPVVVAPDLDIYLSIRVRASKADALTVQLIGMGFATKKLELA